MNSPRLRHLYAPAALVLLLNACGGGGTPAAPTPPPTSAPSFVSHPANATVNEGQTATFTASASGNPSPTYQWRKNGADISGAVSSSYTTPATTAADHGAVYTVVATNSVSSATSSPATLSVNLRPTITTPPASRTVTVGQTATFSVVATGRPTPTYQWRRDGNAIPNATSDSYTTPATVLSDNGAVFTVAVTNAVETVVSAGATLTVQAAATAPSITTHPQGGTFRVGANITLHVEASGTAPFTYQWRKDGSPITGATSQDYVIANAQTTHSGSYTVVVTNSVSSATSNPAVVVVNPAGGTPVEYLQNGSFEAGGTNWSMFDGDMISDAISAVTPYDGNLFLWMGAWDDPTDDWAYQDVEIPADATEAKLTFWMGIGNFFAAGSTPVNTFTLKLTTPAGAPLATLVTKTDQDADVANSKVVWKAYGPYDLSAYKGQKVRLRFDSRQPGTSGTIFAVDLVSLKIAAASTPSPTVTGFTPTHGTPGTSVVITGTNFTGATAVAFAGRNTSTFTVDGPTQITAKVPNGATTGPITITTPLGQATSAQPFTVDAGLDLWIEAVYINQAAQNLQGTVPLIQGRDGLLRVFALATQANTARPDVRVEIHGPAAAAFGAAPLAMAPLWSQTIQTSASSVPFEVNEGVLSASWNLLVPGAYLAPGNRILVTLDPTNAVAEVNETNNTWPANGLPGALNAVALPALRETMVPLKVRSIASRLNASNIDDYLDMARRVLPTHQIDKTLHAEVTSSTTPTCDGPGWDVLLGEVRLLWVAEGSMGNYYGLLNFDDEGYCVRGMGYSGGYPVSIGWDINNTSPGSVSGNASETIAHELGHNFGYRHTACSGEANPDPGYPYANGGIGIYGWDIYASLLRSPTRYKDLMTYCDPYWISDYSYKKMLLWRQANATVEPEARKEACLVLWGQTDGETITLEPSLTLETRAFLPEPGDHVVMGLDIKGRELFRVPFAMSPIADSRNPKAAGFTLALPVKAIDADRLAEVRVLDAEQKVTRAIARSLMLPDARRTAAGMARRLRADRIRLTWDHQVYPLALVRDSASGQIIGILRNGQAELDTEALALDVVFSDGVRSLATKMNVSQ